MSPDLHDVLIAAIPSIVPTAMVGFGILVNKNDVTRISGEIVTLRAEVCADMSSLRNDIARVDSRVSNAVLMLVNIGN
jgi:hypothetical protein